MATNLKITQLPEITSPASNDVLPIVDIGNDTTSKIQYSNLIPVTLTNAVALTNKDLSSGTNTFPTSLVTLTGSQVLTNKTLTKPTINASIQGVQTMSAQALDGTTANIFTRTLATSETFTQSGFTAGQCFMVEVKQGSGTTYTVTWFSGITWVTSGGTAPVQTTTSNGYTTYGFRCTGSSTFLGYLIGTN